MADAKTSALTALAGADVDLTADLLPVVDTSATTTKKITPAELANAIAARAVPFSDFAYNIAYPGDSTPTPVVASGGIPAAFVFNGAGSAFVPATGLFTAPATGIYEFGVYCSLAGAATDTMAIAVAIGGAPIITPINFVSVTGSEIVTARTQLSLTAGDVISFVVTASNAGLATVTATIVFDGKRIK